MEYAPYGNLQEFLRKCRHHHLTGLTTPLLSAAQNKYNDVTLTDLVSFAYQISRGMEYLEQRSVS